MYAITVSYASLLVASIWNGWTLMQGIGRSERLRKMNYWRKQFSGRSRSAVNR